MCSNVLAAQQYRVHTSQTDSFSVAFVRLMNCAVSRFGDCKGDSIRTNWMGTDHQISFSFPGSAAAIVRSREWDINAYVEFRGFTGRKDRDKGINELVAKIKKALGDQLYDPYEHQDRGKKYFYGLSIKDSTGYYSMNMELFASSSSAPVYLLGPEREVEGPRKTDFILLKIYPGIPRYNYYIKNIASPEPGLQVALTTLLRAADTDFDSLRNQQQPRLNGKRQKMDTVTINGYSVELNYHGANYSAVLRFTGNSDSVVYNQQLFFCEQALQAALGQEYVYQRFDMQHYPAVVYFAQKKPRVYLQIEKDGNNRLQVVVRIGSIITHPTKRGLEQDDL